MTCDLLSFEIGTLDVRGNVVWTFGDLWREIFERMEIDICLMDVTPDEQVIIFHFDNDCLIYGSQVNI